MPFERPQSRMIRIALAWVFLAPTLMASSPSRADFESEDLIPRRWGGWYAIGYDDRRVSPQGLGDPETGTGDPAFWFAEPQDQQLSVRGWAQWKTRLLGARTRVELLYERQEWAQGRILGRNLWELEVRQDLDQISSLELEVEHSPQTYRRHRVDKDAPPGTPRYRPQVFSETELELGYIREWGDALESYVFLTHSYRDENRWFNERDRWRTGGGLEIEIPLTDWIEVTPGYAYRASRYRNKPDLGTDRAYYEHLTELALRADQRLLGRFWRLEGKIRWKFRSYTTDDPEDESRYRRDDRIYYWAAKLSRADAEIGPFISAESSGRHVDAPADLDDPDDEDASEVDHLLIRLGLEWSFERED